VSAIKDLLLEGAVWRERYAGLAVPDGSQSMRLSGGSGQGGGSQLVSGALPRDATSGEAVLPELTRSLYPFCTHLRVRIYPKSGYVVAVLANIDPPPAQRIAGA
jgi:hypothetical protein